MNSLPILPTKKTDPQTGRLFSSQSLLDHKDRNTVILNGRLQRVAIQRDVALNRLNIDLLTITDADLVDDGLIFMPQGRDVRFGLAFKSDELCLHLLILSGDIDDLQIDLTVVANRRGLEDALIDLPDILE